MRLLMPKAGSEKQRSAIMLLLLLDPNRILVMEAYLGACPHGVLQASQRLAWRP